MLRLEFTSNPVMRLVHPEDKTPRHKQSNVVYAARCGEDCTGGNQTSQHRRARPSGNDSAETLWKITNLRRQVIRKRSKGRLERNLL